MTIEGLIKSATVFGLVAVIVYVGYLFYEKDSIISISMIVIGLILAIYLVVSENEFKRQRHRAPWLFEEYKGE